MYARARVGVAATAILGLVASGALATTAQAATPGTAISAGLTKVNLLNFNDFHGRIDTAAGLPFACLVQNERAALGADSTLLLSAGDNIGASLFVSSIQQDNPTLDYLNTLGLSAAAVGNHEFDRGFSDLTGRVTDKADFPYLGANVFNRGTTTPALPEYTVKTVNGVKIGIVGAVTAETKSLVSPDGIQGIDFGDPVEAVNRVADKLKAEKLADVVIAEIHDGANQGEGNTPVATQAYTDMVNKLNANVDVVFNGHTHAVYQANTAVSGGQRSISQAGSYGVGLTRVTLGVDPATKKLSQYVATHVPVGKEAAGACLTDTTYLAAKKVVDDAVAKAKELGAKPIGKISADITTAYTDAAVSGGKYTGTKRDDRLRESALGNLVAQAWLEEMNVPGRGGADIGIMNPGGLRSDLFFKSSAAGEGDGVVTFEEASAVNPFANTLVAKDITGAQVKTLLEQQWQPAGSSRGFLNLGLSDNLSYTFDPTRSAGDRITGVFIDGAMVDPNATYTVASSSFLMAGGDNFTVMQEGTNTRDTGMVDTDAFMNFMARQGTLAPDFTKRGVAVIHDLTVGDDVSFRVEGWDMTSLGSPANTSGKIEGDGSFAIKTERVGSPLPVRDGVATIEGTVEGEGYLKLIADQSGTTALVNPRGDLRISGESRFDTSVEISRRLSDVGEEVVYVTSGDMFPDALAAGPVAGADAPVLLIAKDELPSSVAAELGRIKPKKVVAVGGPLTMTDAVLAKVAAAAGVATVERIAGDTRYDTAAKLIPAGTKRTTVYLASGEDFADALAAAPVAAKKGTNILLIAKDSLPAATKAKLVDLGATDVVVVGGPMWVSDKAVAEVRAAVPGATVTRIHGDSRYDTAADLVKTAWTQSDYVFVTSGERFPDALAGTPLAASHDAPILLTRASCVPQRTAAAVADLEPVQTMYLGGPLTTYFGSKVCS